jgi:hypothetical protein
MNPTDVRTANEWAAFYRLRGFNPVPSRPDAKRPMIRYADYWEKPLPTNLFDRFGTSNIQIMTGRYWRLLVIDLDSKDARIRWSNWGRTPDTWITHSGGDGQHLWFRLPTDHPKPIHKAFLWQGDGSHQAIERLCDRSLIMAPPSIHPVTGERYRFIDRHHSPVRLPLPADCPSWILRLRPIGEAPKATACSLLSLPSRQQTTTASSQPFNRDAVLQAIPDKVALARSWGLQTAGRPTQKGWVPCHAIDREDRNPSAAIHQESGCYVDLGSGLRLSLFDIGVELGVYPNWRDAASDLGARYA